MKYTFRGFDIIGYKWVYGDLVHNKKVTETGLEDRTMVGGYEVDPDSVGMFTGLYDKHMRPIFEGDTVTFRKEGENILFTTEVRYVYGGFNIGRSNYYEFEIIEK